MPTENKTFLNVRKDFAVLVPGASVVVEFSPVNGAMIAVAHSRRVPESAILGAALRGAGPAHPVGGGGVAQPFGGGPQVAAGGVAAAPGPGGVGDQGEVNPQGPAAAGGGGAAPAPEEQPVVKGVQEIETRAKAAPVLRPDLGFDLDQVGGIMLPSPDPVLPPEAPVNLRIEVFRPGQAQPVGSRDVSAGGLPLQVTGVPLQPVGMAPEIWTAKFTNIGEDPTECFGEVRFRENRDLRVTTIEKDFLARMMRQAVDGLGMVINLENDDLLIDFDPVAKELSEHKLHQIAFAFPANGRISRRIQSLRPVVSLEEVELDGELWPAIKVDLQFDHDSFSFEIGSHGVDIDFGVEGFGFAVTVVLRQKLRNWLTNPDNPHPKRGDFPGIPFIYAKLLVETDVAFSNPVVDAAVRTFVGDIGGLIEDALNEQAFALSRYFQLAVHLLADREHAFHGLRLANGGDWQVLTGPVFPGIQHPGQPADGLPGNAAPIDGPQPPEELAQLNEINHIVVLMMENRSFDHVLGYLTHPDHGNDQRYDGLLGTERNAVGGIIPDAAPTPMPHTRFYPSPPHGFLSVQRQVNGGAMDGFGEEFNAALHRKNVASDPRSIMNFHVDGQLPVYDRLVRDFTVATRWFAALPGPTFPNRISAFAGRTPILDNEELSEDEAGYLQMATVFDLLEEEDVSWRYYEHDLTMLRMFDRYRLEFENIRPFTEFAADARQGLPKVTYIDPNFVDVPGGAANDDHPGGSDMIDGQNLIASVVNALVQSPGWNRTMLIVTYDEHGGFFDHVSPPGSPANPQAGIAAIHPEGPTMLGVRVPAFIVSPRARRNGVIDRVFDHTSIVKTIIARFLPGQEGRLGPRVAQAAHLGGAVPETPPQVVQGADFPTSRASPLAETEEIDAGSFHDFMNSLGSPAHRSKRLARELLQDLY